MRGRLEFLNACLGRHVPHLERCGMVGTPKGEGRLDFAETAGGEESGGRILRTGVAPRLPQILREETRECARILVALRMTVMRRARPSRRDAEDVAPLMVRCLTTSGKGRWAWSRDISFRARGKGGAQNDRRCFNVSLMLGVYDGGNHNVHLACGRRTEVIAARPPGA